MRRFCLGWLAVLALLGCTTDGAESTLDEAQPLPGGRASAGTGAVEAAELGELVTRPVLSFAPKAAANHLPDALEVQLPLGERTSRIAFPDARLVNDGGVLRLVDDDGQPVAFVLHEVRGRRAEVIVEDKALVVVDPAPGARLTLWAGTSLVDEVRVSAERGEPRYLVRPSSFGRQAARQGAGDLWRREGWRQAVELAPGLAETESLRQQFDCHVLGAAEKESWNLEAFRPAKADWLVDALRHRCNWS